MGHITGKTTIGGAIMNNPKATLVFMHSDQYPPFCHLVAQAIMNNSEQPAHLRTHSNKYTDTSVRQLVTYKHNRNIMRTIMTYNGM